MRIVLVADPGMAWEIAQDLAGDLPQQLRRRVRPDIDWQVTARAAPLVADEQLDVSSAVDVVRPHLPDGDWDAGVFLTDLPRRSALRPVSVEVSLEYRIALVSLPALGFWRMRQRARHVVADVVGLLTGERVGITPFPEEARRRLGGARADEEGLERFIVPGLRGHLRLVFGMVRAHRPWRLLATLSRALAGVFATAAFGIINSSTWIISSGINVWRLPGASVASLLALTAWIIVDHELWERPARCPLPRTRWAIDHPVYALFNDLPRQKWKPRSCGNGAHGLRIDDWARVEVRPWHRPDRRQLGDRPPQRQPAGRNLLLHRLLPRQNHA